MKYAKKMILVEAPIGEVEKTSETVRDLILKKQFDENYLKPNRIFDLDQELKRTLNRSDLDDHEKWTLYNQTLQRFLFHINEERKSNSLNKLFQTSFNTAPTIKDKFHYNREAPHIRNSVFVPEPIPKLRFPLYNNQFDKGQYDMSGRKYEQDRINKEQEALANADQDSLYQSAREIALPVDDESDYEEPYENAIEALMNAASDKTIASDALENTASDELMETEEIEEEKRGHKRTLDNVGGIKRKRVREEKKPVYSYAYGPPLQKWVLDVKNQTNKNRIKSVLKDLASEGIILPKPRVPIYKTKVNEMRSERRSQPYYVMSPSKIRRGAYVMKRKERDVISELLEKKDKTSNIERPRWERLPKIKKQEVKKK